MKNPLRKKAGYPSRALRAALTKLRTGVQTNQAEAKHLLLEYNRLARQQGFDRLYLLLSFDCDTQEDIAAAEGLHDWLSERGLKATFAVPGAQLQEGARVYRRLADAGADFINHGGSAHTEWKDGRYWSATFYHEMTPAQVDADIRAGHEIFRSVFGREAIGFRAPHFGNFQEPGQLETMYRTLRDLKYRFSSSTVPSLALEQGPFIDVGELVEFPLSGTFAAPTSVFDSWSFINSPYDPIVKRDYADAFIETIDLLADLGVVGVLNYYVDPAHVQKSEAFYSALDHVLDKQIETVQFGHLLEIAR